MKYGDPYDAVLHEGEFGEALQTLGIQMTDEQAYAFLREIQEKAPKFTADLIDMAIEDSMARSVEEL
jgi:hypothetical protein